MKCGLTKKQAVALFDSGFYKTLSAHECAMFQLFEPRLCMPFDVFHKAMIDTLGRPVFTHEFASQNVDRLKLELLEQPSAQNK